MNRRKQLRLLLYIGVLCAATTVSLSWYYLGLPPKRCGVHGKWLRRDTVPVVYGLIVHPPGYAEACETNFPNANSYVAGGCTVFPGAAKTARVRYCPDCRAAGEKWNDEHQWPDVSKKRNTTTGGE